MRFIAFLCLAVAAGCASAPRDPAPGASEPVPQVVEPLPIEPPAIEAREEPAVLAEPLPTEPLPTEPPKREEASLPRVPPPSKPAAPPAAKAPAKPAAPPPAAASKPAPALDVASLKARLKDTDGIGVLAKLALKNQMDDLLKQLRATHAGKASAAPLRPVYDTLIAKAVSVLHDGDPGLAGTIAQSREAIWDLLADPVKFHEAS
jgi:hypothetical protein